MVPAGTIVSAVDGIAVTAGTRINGDHGVLTINANGSYTYVANSNFTGTFGDIDSFSYTITAPSGVSSTANLNITLDYTPPNSTTPVALMSAEESIVFSDLISDDLDILGINEDNTQEANVMNLDLSASPNDIVDSDIMANVDNDFLLSDNDFMLSDFIQTDEGQYIDFATDETGNITLVFTGQEVSESAIAVDQANNESVTVNAETDTSTEVMPQVGTDIASQIAGMAADNVNMNASNDWDNLNQIANTSYIV